MPRIMILVNIRAITILVITGGHQNTKVGAAEIANGKGNLKKNILPPSHQGINSIDRNDPAREASKPPNNLEQKSGHKPPGKRCTRSGKP